MNKRIPYNIIISEIEKCKGKDFVLDQKCAKKLVHDELPKSVFSLSYMKKRSNELARYLLDNGIEFEIIEPKIIIHK